MSNFYYKQSDCVFLSFWKKYESVRVSVAAAASAQEAARGGVTQLKDAGIQEIQVFGDFAWILLCPTFATAEGIEVYFKFVMILKFFSSLLVTRYSPFLSFES